MDFSFAGEWQQESTQDFVHGLRLVMEAKGHAYVADPDHASLVLNFFPYEKPRPFRRRAQAVFLLSVTEVPVPFSDPIPIGYPILVRSLANLFIGLAPHPDGSRDAHFLTPEQGYYRVDAEEGNPSSFYERVYQRIEPLATSRLVIDNVYHDDLPHDLWEGDEITEAIYRAGRTLDALNLLPAPFPLDEILSERELRHLKKLYGLGGLSYGNISARKDQERFWMSASGVDKANLKIIGRDILMVKDYDATQPAMILSVPPEIVPRRVSVDAIEHWMIYQEHPEVGAILHVHAWMDGIPSTEFNFPCGTYELGKAVADLVRTADDPARAVVGLKNHGLTITGTSLDDIFQRVEGRLNPTVPMS